MFMGYQNSHNLFQTGDFHSTVRLEHTSSLPFEMHRKSASEFHCWTHVREKPGKEYVIVAIYRNCQLVDSALISPDQLHRIREALSVGDSSTAPVKTKTGAELQVLGLGKSMGKCFSSAYFDNKLFGEYDMWRLLYRAPQANVGMHSPMAVISAFALVKNLVSESFDFQGYHRGTFVPPWQCDWNVAVSRLKTFENMCESLSFERSAFHSLCIALTVYHGIWDLQKHVHSIDFKKYFLGSKAKRCLLEHLRSHKPALVYEADKYVFRLIRPQSYLKNNETTFAAFQEEDGTVTAQVRGRLFKVPWSELMSLSSRAVCINFEPIYRPIFSHPDFIVQGRVFE